MIFSTIRTYIIKTTIRETLSEQIARNNDASLLERRIEEIIYKNLKEDTLIDKIKKIFTSTYRYYFNDAVKTNKKAYTKIIYNDLIKKEYSENLATIIAKSTPIPIKNNYLKNILAFGYAISVGRILSETHFKIISKKADIPQEKLMKLSFIVEIPTHTITAIQLYPQLYVLTKGISETLKTININTNITPTYEQIVAGLISLTAIQYLYYIKTKKYVRGYYSLTTIPFGAMMFWLSTAHEKYLKYKSKTKKVENLYTL